IKTNNFPCTICGVCCKSIDGIPELQKFNNGGICIHLTKNNTCAIYDTRPLICRIDEMYNMYFAQYYTKNQFYNENIKICNKLQKKLKLNKRFRIKLIQED
ncbi:YkgJ family cysteine cluster protein, partial [Campylobacter jejuni]